MYNPIKRIDEAFRKGPVKDGYKRAVLHPAAEWYEIIAFLSFLPAMFIFLHAFVISAANMVASFQIEKGQFGLATSIIVVFDVLPFAASIWVLLEYGIGIGSLGIALLCGSLGILGLVAVRKQRRKTAEAAR
ncbi:hypothetical protein [Pseudoteredinibacter isoporae]|uniref:hypothetical protein n=1 Tax=Pseudoteredinibacter isoporae TaxID=570281 RepID=UPI003109CCB3